MTDNLEELALARVKAISSEDLDSLDQATYDELQVALIATAREVEGLRAEVAANSAAAAKQVSDLAMQVGELRAENERLTAENERFRRLDYLARRGARAALGEAK